MKNRNADAHLKRERAWAVFPYPCIGCWHFLIPCILDQERYPEVRDRLARGQKLVDLGCAFAQDIRLLVCDGVSPENVYGIDIEKGYIDLGYDLFLDKQKLSSQFIIANLFDEEPQMNKLDGQIDIVYASQFFHIFGWQSQVKGGVRLVRLLRPVAGSLIIGYQCGSYVAHEEVEGVPTPEGRSYLHNPASLQKLWDEIGERTATSWKAEVFLDEPEILKPYRAANPDLVRLSFSIERLE